MKSRTASSNYSTTVVLFQRKTAETLLNLTYALIPVTLAQCNDTFVLRTSFSETERQSGELEGMRHRTWGGKPTCFYVFQGSGGKLGKRLENDYFYLIIIIMKLCETITIVLRYHLQLVPTEVVCSRVKFETFLRELRNEYHLREPRINNVRC